MRPQRSGERRNNRGQDSINTQNKKSKRRGGLADCYEGTALEGHPRNDSNTEIRKHKKTSWEAEHLNVAEAIKEQSHKNALAAWGLEDPLKSKARV